jgi:hypothetical protein
VSQVQCTPTGEHALPVRSAVAAVDTRRTRFFSLAISCTASTIAELGTSTMASTPSTSIQRRAIRREALPSRLH